MKSKNLLLVLGMLFVSISLFSQKQEDISRLFTKAPIVARSVQDFADDVIGLEINKDYLSRVFEERNNDISITLPYKDNENITLELKQFKVLLDGFILRSSKGDTIEDYKPGLFYKGKIVGKKGFASLFVHENEVVGIIAMEGVGNIDLVKLKNSDSDYVMYQTSKIKVPKGSFCDVSDEDIPVREHSKEVKEMAKRSGSGICFYIEGDYALYLDKGSVSEAANYCTDLFAEVQVLYNEIDVDLGINEIMIWEEDDGYDTGSSSVALDQFEENNPDPNGGLASLYALGGVNTGGLAYVDVLCGSKRYAYMNIHSTYNIVPVFSWTVEVVAHEVGHNFGSRHTHACVWGPDGDTQIDDCGSEAGYVEGDCYDPGNPILPDAGTIMSYCHLVTGIGIDFNLGFGDEPGALITENYGDAGCAGECDDDEVQVPEAAFSADEIEICEGDDVEFEDLSTNEPDTWAWTFDGAIPEDSDEQNPYVTYYNAGVYDVTLEASNSAGSNTLTEEEYITVYPIAIPEFTYEIVDDTVVHFTNLSELATVYEWDFDDGEYSDDEEPIHTYTEDGSYSVTLTASNDECTTGEDYTLVIDIVTAPTAGLTMDHNEGCKIDTIHFFDASTSNVTSRFWTFEAGTPATSVQKNPIVKYDSAGVFNVKLIVYNSAYSDTIKYVDTIKIHTNPVADFLPSINGNIVTFTNTTYDGNTYHWDFGDGATSTDTNTVHTYNTGGDYNVELIANNNCGPDTVVKVIHLTLEANADFTVDTTIGCTVFNANFHSLSNTEDIRWEFQGGIPDTSTAIHPIIKYNNPGVYDVTLYATNALGQDTMIRQDYIQVLATPTGSFVSSQSGSIVTFTQTTTSVDTFNWDFGDGTFSTDENPVHTYAEDGTYVVRFTYGNGCGMFVYEDNVVIANPPTANYTYDVNGGCGPLTVHFTNESSSNSNSFLWTFEGGTPATSTEENPTVVYNTNGKYDVSLKVTNTVGDNTKFDNDLIDVYGTPTPNFTTTNNELEYTFTYTGVTASTVNWDFGEGSPKTGQVVTHIYSTEGDFTVKVTAINDCGEESMTRVVNVVARPTAMFNNNPTEGCAPLTVNFTNLSTSFNAILWQFEGGNPEFSTENNQDVVYSTTGKFDVSLIAYGASHNDTMKVVDAIKVDAGPTSDYSYVVNLAKVKFTAECSADATQFYWDFGDGSTVSTDKNPEHTYSSTGTYTVTLYASNSCGQQSATKQIYVNVTSTTDLFFDEVKLYPNPNDGKFSVSMEVKKEGKYILQIMNVSGKMIEKRSIDLNSGKNTIEYKMDNLNSGIYIMRISNNESKYDMLFNVK